MLAVFLLQIAVPAVAATIDAGVKSALTIDYKYDGEAISGARFDLYYAAECPSTGVFHPVSPFDSYPVDFSGADASEWSALALALKGYVLRDKPAPIAFGVTGSDGSACFEDLQPGLYLVVGGHTVSGGRIYECEPFLIALPVRNEDDSGWASGVTVKPKPQQIGSTPVSIKVLKIWDDAGAEELRPTEVTICLLCDGIVNSTVKLSAGNNWRYEWSELEGGHDWTVTEEAVPSYWTSVTRAGNTFTVRNTRPLGGGDDVPPNPPSPPGDGENGEASLPQTGMLWWPVPLLIAGGLVFLVIGCIRRKSGTQEDR